MNPALSQFLNMARWMAAWVVLLSHVRKLLLVQYAQVENPSLLVKGFYNVSGMGHEAVMVFFVISGYLVGGFSWARWQRDGLNICAYFCHRFSRIYTVLLPALLVGWGLDVWASHAFNLSGLYTEGERFSIGSVKAHIVGALSLTTFLGNVLMLEEAFVPTLGSNGVVWSLVYEWWYYCVFSAAACVWFGRGTSQWVGVAMLIAMLVLLPPYLLFMGLLWLLGVGVFFYGRAGFPLPPVWLALVMFAFALGCTRVHLFGVGFLSDSIVATGFAFLLLAAHGMQRVWWSRLHAWLASFSYSTYLVHVPLLFALTALLHDVFGVSFQRQPDAMGLVYVACMCAVLLVWSWAFAWFTERHTQRLRQWCESVFCAR